GRARNTAEEPHDSNDGVQKGRGKVRCGTAAAVGADGGGAGGDGGMGGGGGLMAEHNRWIKFFPRDYLADTRLLTTEEHGAYFLLWCEIVMRDGKLPSDPATLQALASVRDTAK